MTSNCETPLDVRLNYGASEEAYLGVGKQIIIYTETTMATKSQT